jgi:16S rRNA processing protein RimM
LKQYLEAGEFVTTHGIGGELKLYHWCDDANFLINVKTFYFSENGQGQAQVASIRVHKNACLVKFCNVNNIDEARPYIGKIAYISRGDVKLPKGSFFIADILGAKIIDAKTGEEYGHIKNVSHPGRHDVYEIERESGQMVLFAAAPPFIDNIDIENKTVKIKPIEGMFE